MEDATFTRKHSLQYHILKEVGIPRYRCTQPGCNKTHNHTHHQKVNPRNLFDFTVVCHFWLFLCHIYSKFSFHFWNRKIIHLDSMYWHSYDLVPQCRCFHLVARKESNDTLVMLNLLKKTLSQPESCKAAYWRETLYMCDRRL